VTALFRIRTIFCPSRPGSISSMCKAPAFSSISAIFGVVVDVSSDRPVKRQAFESVVHDYVFINVGMVRSRPRDVEMDWGPRKPQETVVTSAREPVPIATYAPAPAGGRFSVPITESVPSTLTVRPEINPSRKLQRVITALPDRVCGSAVSKWRELIEDVSPSVTSPKKWRKEMNGRKEDFESSTSTSDCSPRMHISRA